jgi:glycogen synthase
LRVLFWAELFPPTVGGVSTEAASLLPPLKERGVELAVVTASEVPEVAGREAFAGVPVHRFPFWSALAAGDGRRIVELRKRIGELVSRLDPQLIHVTFLGPSVLFLLHALSRFSAALLVVLDAGVPESASRGGTIVRAALEKAAWVVAPSRSSLERLHALAPQVGARSSLIFHGRTVPALAPAALPFDPPHLLCLGRLEHVKGFDLALQALPVIRQRFPEAALTIAGEGSERAGLEKLSDTLGVRDAVQFVGTIDPHGVPEALNAATVVLLPSRSETFGFVAVEAGMMGRPVVAAASGGLRDIVRQGRTGLLVAPDDPAALAAATAAILADPEMAERLGRAARRSVRQRFGADRAAERYLSLYRRLAIAR